MVNHLYGNRNKPLRDEINKQRKDMGIDKFEGLLPDWQGSPYSVHAVLPVKDNIPAKTERTVEVLSEFFHSL